MKIVTRQNAIRNLKKYVGKDLRSLALEYGVTTYETGKQNKGWKGLILERLAGLENNVSKAPNGLSWELKSVGYINTKELKEQSFFESHCWAKLKSIIFCAVMWNGHNAEKAELIKVVSLDFLE